MPRFIPKRLSGLVFVASVAFTMSAVMSLAITIVNTGVGGDLAGRWLKAWPIAFMIALPTALVLIPTLRRLVDRCTLRQ